MSCCGLRGSPGGRGPVLVGAGAAGAQPLPAQQVWLGGRADGAAVHLGVRVGQCLLGKQGTDRDGPRKKAESCFPVELATSPPCASPAVKFTEHQ